MTDILEAFRIPRNKRPISEVDRDALQPEIELDRLDRQLKCAPLDVVIDQRPGETVYDAMRRAELRAIWERQKKSIYGRR